MHMSQLFWWLFTSVFATSVQLSDFNISSCKPVDSTLHGCIYLQLRHGPRLPARPGKSHRDLPSPQPSSTTFCQTIASQTRIWRQMVTANRLIAALVRWSDREQLAIAPQKSCVTLFTHQSSLHPQVWIFEDVALLNRTSKILGIPLDTHFTSGPRTYDWIERASRALNVTKALAGAIWLGLWWRHKKALNNVHNVLYYAPNIWFTQVPSSHLDMLQLIQNKEGPVKGDWLPKH